jgi:hypothetical protein
VWVAPLLILFPLFVLLTDHQTHAQTVREARLWTLQPPGGGDRNAQPPAAQPLPVPGGQPSPPNQIQPPQAGDGGLPPEVEAVIVQESLEALPPDGDGNIPAQQQPREEIPAPEADTEGILLLADVIASVYRAYPSIEKARLEGNLTQGLVLEAFGAYDTKLQGYSLAEPLGFYNNYRQGLGVARQTWWGGYLSAGYRIGRGDFAPWYKERETNRGGEFKLGVGMPLLQGRAIDPERVTVFQAQLAERAVGPMVQNAILWNSREAAMVYWDWVTAGAAVRAQRDLLDLSVRRGEIFERGFEVGRIAQVDVILNAQLIAERQAKLLELEQKLRASSFKLSLYLRNEMGLPIIPPDLWLPRGFPPIERLDGRDYNRDLADAINRRPELALLQIQQRQVQIEQELARNDLLPSLDLLAEASQDVGTPVSPLNDKGQFELLVGLQGEVPIQRRKARGKIQSTAAKIGQLDQELRLQRDRIGTELQTAYNALALSREVVEQTEIALRTARETLRRFLFGLQAGSGKVDLIFINLLETKVNEVELKLLESRRNWYFALVDMQTALGLDPLDQAMLLDQ